MTLHEQVERLEQQHDSAMNLLGEILATLLLEPNQEAFAELPEQFHVCVASWERRWRTMGGAAAYPNGLLDEPCFA